MSKTLWTLFSLLCFCLCACLFPAALGAAPKAYRAVRINPQPPVIDGLGSDPVWNKASWEAGFLQNAPRQGEKPSQETAFKILFDDEALYVFIRASDSEPGRIDRRLARRDDWKSDSVGLWLDTYHDHRTAFLFLVTAGGVKTDGICSNDELSSMENGVDFNWDPIWSAKTLVDGEGWTAEIRIPLSQLRFGSKKEQSWGLQVERRINRANELSRWQLIPNEAKGFASLFGDLEGIIGLRPSRRIELLPYSVGSLQTDAREEGNPFAPGLTRALSGGLDGKVGLTSDLNLDFTLNPDFGQVEADPSYMNLSAYEVFLQEKRPFFIEGSNILNYRVFRWGGSLSQDTLFYSRRIGQPPHGWPTTEPGEYFRRPDSTSILAAFKLTGKTENGLSLGVLDALTSEENAELDLLGRRRMEPVEPTTNFFVGRVQKDYDGGNFVVGGMLTAVGRRISSSGLNDLSRAAYSGGFDLVRYWRDKTYYFTLNVIASHILGSREALLQTQTSPVHYFQRPDASHATLDPERTSLSGYGGTLEFGKSGGGNFRFISSLTWRSPGLELNDVGFLRQADLIRAWLQAKYVTFKPFGPFLNFSLALCHYRDWDFGGRLLRPGLFFELNTVFKNNWNLYLSADKVFFDRAANVLRGGPSFRSPGMTSSYFILSSDQSKPWRISAGPFYGPGDAGSSEGWGAFFEAAYRPHPALEFSAQPMIYFFNDELQYVASPQSGLENRYICGRMDMRMASLTLRLNLSLSPELTIQYYGQPFISTGKYSGFKIITDPGAADWRHMFRPLGGNDIRFDGPSESYRVDENGDGLADFEFDRPDFRTLQFRSNLVLRWEYRPGSILYLVWSQGRTGFSPDADLGLGQGLADLFHLQPRNVFLVKFSYWFTL